MFVKLLLLFVVVPLVELTLLLVLADWTDWKFTLGLVIVTGLVGTILARSQGVRTFRHIQTELAEGKMPKESLLDAVMIFIAGALLLTPGILTDALGLSLLIPICRKWYRRLVVRWLKSRFHIDKFTPGAGPPDRTSGDVIESSFVKSTGDEENTTGN